MEAPVGNALDEATLRRLLEVGRGLVAELDTGAVLERLLEVARELTGARYAAIGVLDSSGSELASFLTAGIDEQTRKAIGAPPRGRGVLGVLITDPEPLRLTEVGGHPRSYGFPPGHPPMESFLGVPIRVRDEIYGNLYLTEKPGGRFTGADEEAIGVLADWAAIAIDNARLYGAERDRRAELEAANRGLEATIDITRAIGVETDLDRVLELICKRARALVDAKSILIMLADEQHATLTIASVAGDADPKLVGTTVPAEGSVSEQVMRSGSPMRLMRRGASTRRAHPLARHLEPATGTVVPLSYRGRSLGVLTALDEVEGRDFGAEEERLLVAFAASASIAVATAQRFAEQGRRRSIEASERERARWARELHDETLQELAGLKLLLGSLRRSTSEPALDDAIEQTELSITGLRHLITELRPAALDEAGLQAALEGLVDRVEGTSGVEVLARIELDGERLTPEVESAVYRVAQESVNNAVRHSGARAIDLIVRCAGGDVVLEVRDDGAGLPEEPSGGFGIIGMRERVELLGGEIEFDSAPGSGLTVRARVPVGT